MNSFNIMMICAVFILSLTTVYAQSYCDVRSCREEVDRALKAPTFCQKAPPYNVYITLENISNGGCDTTAVEEAVRRCIRWNSGIPCPTAVRNEMKDVSSLIELQYDNTCGVRAARAMCPLVQMFGCAIDFAAVFSSPNLFPLEDMDEFCRDLNQVVGAVQKCVNCVGLFFDNWNVLKNDIEFIGNVTRVLVAGGCNCASNITKQINQIDKNSTCRTVEDIATISKTLASNCIVPSINAVAEFEWVTMTENMLSTVLNIAQRACLFFNAAPTVTSSSTIIISGIFFSLILSYIKY